MSIQNDALLVIPELGIKQQTCTLKRVEQVVERAKEALSEEALRLGLGKDQDIGSLVRKISLLLRAGNRWND